MLRTLFIACAVALILFALPGVVLLGADLLGVGGGLNSFLERALGVSHRVAVISGGEIVEWGDCDQVTANPQHPHTKQLLLASPLPDPDRQAARRAERQLNAGRA